MSNETHVWHVSALVLSVADAVGLLPMAFAMPGIAESTVPLGNAIVFALLLTGPFLLFSFGVRGLLGWGPVPLLACVTILMIGSGAALLWQAHGVLLEWIALSVALALIAAVLRGPVLWGIVGGGWTAIVLGVLGGRTFYDFLAPSSTTQFPKWGLVWAVECLLTAALAVIILRWQSGGGPTVPSAPA